MRKFAETTPAADPPKVHHPRQLSDDEIIAKIPTEVLRYCQTLQAQSIKFRLEVRDTKPTQPKNRYAPTIPGRTIITVYYRAMSLPGPLPKGASFVREN